jgi:hypothetical protein
MSFRTLEGLSAQIADEHKESVKENEAWAKSAFGWMRILPPSSKGLVGRKMASGLLQSFGFTPGTSRYLVVVNGSSITVKTSMVWGAGQIKFQNIRDSKFDFTLCLGIYPTKSYGWLIPKDEIWASGKVQKREGLTLQHGGKSGNDAWITIDPKDIPKWLEPYGGTTNDLIKVAKTAL